MYTQHTDKELLSLIREIMKEVKKRRLSTKEKAAYLIYGLSPEEMSQEQEAAATEAISAVRAEQLKEISASARKKEERLQQENEAHRHRHSKLIQSPPSHSDAHHQQLSNPDRHPAASLAGSRCQIPTCCQNRRNSPRASSGTGCLSG